MTLTIIIAIGVIVWLTVRQLGDRKIKVNRMWITPTLVFYVTAHLIWQGISNSSLALIVISAMFVLGIGIGWARGKMTSIEIYRDAGVILVKGSPYATLFWLGLIAVKILAHDVAKTSNPSVAEAITKGLLALTLGYISSRRVYWYYKYSQSS